MVPGPASGLRAAREPLFDVHPQPAPAIEVFYAYCTLETFGRLVLGSVFGRFSSPVGRWPPR